jgi:ABC-type transport system involved in multi-copper enzyme maturation permease subunit
MNGSMFGGVGRMVRNIVMILVGLILIGIIVPNIDTLLSVFSSSANKYYGTQIYLLIPLFLGVGMLAFASWDTYQGLKGGGAKARKRA